MGSREADRRVLADLTSHGSDLTKPAHTVHYLYFKSANAANAAAEELRSAGYEKVTVDRAPASSIWQRLFGPHEFSCIAETHAIPSEAAVSATTDHMEALAIRHGGQYDGWVASVEQ